MAGPHFPADGAAQVAPGEVIDTPERARELGLTADAARMERTTALESRWPRPILACIRPDCQFVLSYHPNPAQFYCPAHQVPLCPVTIQPVD